MKTQDTVAGIILFLRYFIETFIQITHTQLHAHSSNSHTIHSHERSEGSKENVERKKVKEKEKKSDSLEGEITWEETITVQTEGQF
jgi:hypothetical protein